MQYLRIQNPWHSPLSDEPEEGLIPCEVVRSSRKTIAIQITAEGRLVLRIPRRASVQAAMRFAEEHRDWAEIKLSIREALSIFLWQKTKRSPMILPIIMEV